jgi:hypothetical protein
MTMPSGEMHPIRMPSAPKLPPGPWDMHIEHCGDGDRSYQIQAADGEIVGDWFDSHFDGPGAAEACARAIFGWAAAFFGRAGIIDGSAARVGGKGDG